LRSTEILLSHDGECAHVVLDRYVVETAIAHLLQNAVKFSTANGLVKFNISCGPKEVTFTIADEGIGIPQAEQARIFAAFSRASNSGTIPGIGLGLAIVKQLVELHGGIISCERREDVGMIFTVVLPHLTATTNEETISHA
jgi:signal transduction histidine kinase